MVLQGRYRVIELLASGGMGVVYRGERVGLGRAVAIKFIWPWIAQEEQIRKRFDIEARAMSRLSHPSCVGVIDFGVEEGAPYLVMDFASGRTLGAVLKAGRLPIAEALHIARQVLGALAHAHAQGIIHRDIKPDNIILSETSGFGAQVRILDFGLAKLKDTSSTVTTGLALGTPSYMAPEQTCGDPVDTRSDIYAVGVMLFEMLTGTRPFRSEQMSELMRMHREAPPPTLRDAAPDAGFSPAIEAVVARALAKAREARFASAADFASALDATPEAAAPRKDVQQGARDDATVASRRAAQSAGASIASPNALAPTSAPRSRWGPRVAAGVVVLGGIAGVGAWLLTRAESPPAAAAPPGSLAAALAEPAPPISPPSSASEERPAPPTDSEPTPRDVAVSPPTERAPVPGFAQAQALVRAGHEAAALDALRKLRVKYPDHPDVAYLMGNVYFDRMWWGDGFDAYRVAVSREPAYRHDRTLISNVLKSFISERYGATGARFIEREIGAPAIPYLEQATRSNSLSVRAHASRLLAKLNRAR
jgi:eukaryotic-like serine/threonine-protein kinase